LLRRGSYDRTEQWNFSRMQRNSYGAYGIFLTTTVKRQQQHGNGRVETRRKSSDTIVIVQQTAGRPLSRNGSGNVAADHSRCGECKR